MASSSLGSYQDQQVGCHHEETSIREETDELWKGGVDMTKSLVTTCMPIYVQQAVLEGRKVGATVIQL
jgi:hypothetical protein